MTISGIYQITHEATGRRYIGSAIDIGRRVSHHKSLLKRGKHHNRFLQAAWIKYGESAFKFSTVCLYAEPMLLYIEQRFIDLLNPEFNVFKKAINSARGVKRSDETRRKLSESQRGKIITQEQRDKISRTLTGRPTGRKGIKLDLTPEQRAARAENSRKTRNALGHKVSDEAKAKISASKAANPYKMTDSHRDAIKAAKGWKHDPETIERMKEIKRQWWAARKAEQA